MMKQISVGKGWLLKMKRMFHGEGSVFANFIKLSFWEPRSGFSILEQIQLANIYNATPKEREALWNLLWIKQFRVKAVPGI